MPIVYVLSNPAMPGLVKIGKTTRDDTEIRMWELYTTGVPVPFECEYAVEVDDERKLERALHEAFEPSRINPRREFFKIEADQAVAILSLFGENVAARVNEADEAKIKPAELDAGKRLKRARLPNLDFHEMGLGNGSELVLVHNENLIVTVCGPKKVMCQGEEMSLTRATKTLHDEWRGGLTKHWLSDGRSLSDIYRETYIPEE